MLGIREPEIYGSATYADLCGMITDYCNQNGINVKLFQSNHEGEIVDEIQSAYKKFDGIVINPAAYTHTSVALLDALKSVGIRAVEVHISDVASREDFRQVSYVRLYCEKTICGKGFAGYIDAIKYLTDECGE